MRLATTTSSTKAGSAEVAGSAANTRPKGDANAEAATADAKNPRRTKFGTQPHGQRDIIAVSSLCNSPILWEHRPETQRPGLFFTPAGVNPGKQRSLIMDALDL